MSSRRPLLRAIFDAAVAAAHPDIVLPAYLPAAPKAVSYTHLTLPTICSV